MATMSFTYTSKELNARERIQLKDRSNAINIGTALKESDTPLIIDIDYYAVLHIEVPDKTENAEKEDDSFDSYIFVDKNGTKYTTSSPSLWNAFTQIKDELLADGITDFKIECYKAPSQKRQGEYLCCRLV